MHFLGTDDAVLLATAVLALIVSAIAIVDVVPSKQVLSLPI
jgi:hypothetical protein